MRIGKGMVFGCVLMLCVSMPVSAQTTEQIYREQLTASGGELLAEALPEEAERLLDSIGITDPNAEQFAAMDATAVWRMLAKMVDGIAGQPLSVCAVVLGTIVLYAWVDGMKQTLRTDDAGAVFGVICTLTACGSVMVPLADVIRTVCAAMESVSVFMQSFIPVYAGILISGGYTATAAGFQTTVLLAAEALAYLAKVVIVPLLTVSLAMGLTGTLTPELHLGQIGRLTGKAATWMLTFATVIFTGVLSLQSLTAGASDKISDRALRFSVSHLVPVVGGSLGEAFSAVRGCLSLLRSTVGCFGVVATAAIVLPPLLSCVVWNMTLNVGQTAADVFGLTAFSALMKTARGIVRCLIGILCVSGLLLTVSLTVITLALGGSI